MNFYIEKLMKELQNDVQGKINEVEKSVFRGNEYLEFFGKEINEYEQKIVEVDYEVEQRLGLAYAREQVLRETREEIEVKVKVVGEELETFKRMHENL